MNAKNEKEVLKFKTYSSDEEDSNKPNLRSN